MVFQNDQKHYFEQRNMSMTRKREEDDEVNKALVKFEEHMRKCSENRQNELNKISNLAHEHIEKVVDRMESVKSKKDCIDNDVNFRIKIEKSIKKQREYTKERQKMLIVNKRNKAEKLAQELQRAKQNIKIEEKKLAERWGLELNTPPPSLCIFSDFPSRPQNRYPSHHRVGCDSL